MMVKVLVYSNPRHILAFSSTASCSNLDTLSQVCRQALQQSLPQLLDTLISDERSGKFLGQLLSIGPRQTLRRPRHLSQVTSSFLYFFPHVHSNSCFFFVFFLHSNIPMNTCLSPFPFHLYHPCFVHQNVLLSFLVRV